MAIVADRRVYAKVFEMANSSYMTDGDWRVISLYDC